jgi:hypothetical protein
LSIETSEQESIQKTNRKRAKAIEKKIRSIAVSCSTVQLSTESVMRALAEQDVGQSGNCKGNLK